jgi:hypothetical protein
MEHLSNLMISMQSRKRWDLDGMIDDEANLTGVYFYGTLAVKN